MLRCDSTLFGIGQFARQAAESRPPAVTGVTPEPPRESTGARRFVTGVELQPTMKAASRAGISSFSWCSPLKIIE
ncbi:MAG: hypothetical protein IPG91_19630 [Ideonella sp.]|nr:hypothetical protein [Ideonella sp.]